MSSKAFDIWNNENVSTLNNIQAGVETNVLVSDWIRNDSGTIYNSIRVNIDYSNVQPFSGSYFIGATVEAETPSGVSPIHYQFSPFRSNNQANTRILILQPNIDTFNLGIDDIVFPVDEEVARISRSQGILPETRFRVVITIKENSPGTNTALSSLTVSANGVMYNV